MARELRGDNIKEPRLRPEMTIGETYGPAMMIENQEEADRYFEDLVELFMSYECNNGKPREEAERVVRSNLGYYAGYYGNDVRERAEKLFKCEHPFFGSIAEKEPPTPEEAFEMGVKMGKEMRSKT